MINSINLPKHVLFIIKDLEKYGFEAYAVGGCIRDSLLGIAPKDWDICTSASPNQVTKVLSKYHIISIGKKFGTISVLINKQVFEITTYRKESNYISHRKPQSIAFISSLKKDLKRRDFTINSIAYHPIYGIIDYYNGIHDLKKGIIRCIGNPLERFEEDALRIMRAFRFCSTLGFNVDDTTKKAMSEKKSLLKKISKERISLEFITALCGNYVSTALSEFADIISVIIPELTPIIYSEYKPNKQLSIWESIILSIYKSEPLILVRLCLLFKYISLPNCLNERISNKTIDSVAQAIKISKKDTQDLKKLIKHQNDKLPTTIKQTCFKLNELKSNIYSLLLKVRLASSFILNENDKKIEMNKIEKSKKLLDYVIKNNICYCIKQLNINGNDLLNIGYKKGPKIKVALNNILNAVMNGDINNSHDELIIYAKKMYIKIN